MLPRHLRRRGIVSILLTRRNQRLGDLCRRHARGQAPCARPMGASRRRGARRRLAASGAWDVSAVTVHELDGAELPRPARWACLPRAQAPGRDLAGRLRPKVAGCPPEVPDERFLEGLAAAKLDRG